MAYDKRTALVLRVCQSTDRNEISWQETEAEGVFQADFPDYSIRVSKRSVSRGEAPDIILAILDSEGTILDEVSDDEVSEDIGVQKAYPMMLDLYETARRIALGVEKALDDLLGLLPVSEAEEAGSDLEVSDDEIPF